MKRELDRLFEITLHGQLHDDLRHRWISGEVLYMRKLLDHRSAAPPLHNAEEVLSELKVFGESIEGLWIIDVITDTEEWSFLLESLDRMHQLLEQTGGHCNQVRAVISTEMGLALSAPHTMRPLADRIQQILMESTVTWRLRGVLKSIWFCCRLVESLEDLDKGRGEVGDSAKREGLIGTLLTPEFKQLLATVDGNLATGMNHFLGLADVARMLSIERNLAILASQQG